jgi:hypothetical protein
MGAGDWEKLKKQGNWKQGNIATGEQGRQGVGKIHRGVEGVEIYRVDR